MTHEDTAKASGWDLHCHTVFSDGTVTPRGMVEQAQQLGLEGLAITDHDTNAGWDQARKAAQDLGMPLLPGTEITAQDGRVSVHMLAYLYDPKDPPRRMAVYRFICWPIFTTLRIRSSPGFSPRPGMPG